MRDRWRGFIVASVNVEFASLGPRSLSRFPLGGDGLLALALAVSQALVVVTAREGGIGARAIGALAALGFLALAWRRRYPLAVLAVAFVAALVQELVEPGHAGAVLFLAIALASYSLGAHAPRRSLLVGFVLGLVGVVAGHALARRVPGFSNASADVFLALVLVLAPVGVGRVVRARGALAERLDAAAGRLRSLRGQRLSSAVERERERLAAQLQPVMLEGLEAMDGHAQVRSLEAVTALERAARETLGRMRSVLVGLRSEPRELRPPRTLPELHARVARALAADSDTVDRESEQRRSPGRWTLLSPTRVDTGLAIVAACLTVAVVIMSLSAASGRGPRLVDALLAAGTVAPIAFLRRAPLRAAAVGLAAMISWAALAAPSDPLSGVAPTGLLICFPFAIGARYTLRMASAGLVLCLIATAAVLAADPHATSDVGAGLPSSAWLIIGAWAAGYAVGERSRLLTALADTAEQIEHEHDLLARERLVEERNRVARELHDAFAHSMTVIVLQAGAARRAWTANPELARGHAAVVRQTLRETLGELRELILAVAEDQDPPAAVSRIERLINRVCAAGMPVELLIDGSPRPAAAEIEHTAYRIVQEALTNAARHAPGAVVRVRERFSEAELAIEIENGPCQRKPDAGEGAGHGLRGMRERAASCGGELAAAHQPGGGFLIAARLPLDVA
jgi:signal transduction histidine kinase